MFIGNLVNPTRVLYQSTAKSSMPQVLTPVQNLFSLTSDYWVVFAHGLNRVIRKALQRGIFKKKLINTLESILKVGCKIWDLLFPFRKL